jgi:hypothetical protein
MNPKVLKFLSGLAVVVVVGLLASVSIDTAKSASNVTVTATVNETVSCVTANTSSTAFGTLDTSAVFTAATNASTSLSCNTGLGCTLRVNDLGNGASPGLATSSPAYLIASANATLAAGTEGYGIQATSTTGGSGGTLTINTTYNVTSTVVGGLLIAQTTLASSTVQVSSRPVLVKHLAAIGGTTQAALYTDIIFYSCTAN